MTDKDLFNSGQYNEIIKKYKGREKELELWNLYWFSRSYYKIKEYNESIRIYELYKNLNPKNDNLKNAIIWAFYYVMKSNKNKVSILKFANYIINNCKQEDFSPFQNTVEFVIKFLENEKEVPNKKELYEWLIKLNPDLLSKEPYITQKDGKSIELSSKHEKYYASKSKYEFDLNLYNECIETCKIALKNIYKFHTYNDVWFKFKMSKALKEIGKINDAKEILEKLCKIHKHFAIKSKLGDILIELGDREQATRFYYQGLVSKVGSLGNKVTLIEKVADVLKQNSDLENAKLNYLLVKKIREKNEWGISTNLMNKINNLKHVELKINENELINTCTSTWYNVYCNSLEKGEGKVTFLFNNNRGGFIEFQDKNIYFNINEMKNYKINDLLNKTVKFNIIDGYDKKKKEIQKEAINIQIIKDE